MITLIPNTCYQYNRKSNRNKKWHFFSNTTFLMVILSTRNYIQDNQHPFCVVLLGSTFYMTCFLQIHNISFFFLINIDLGEMCQIPYVTRGIFFVFQYYILFETLTLFLSSLNCLWSTKCHRTKYFICRQFT